VCDTVGVHDLGAAQLVLRCVHLLAEQLVEGCRDVLETEQMRDLQAVLRSGIERCRGEHPVLALT
jgi:hypothetical protein